MDREAISCARLGREQNYSAARVQGCPTVKFLFGVPLRQATGFVEGLVKFVDLDLFIVTVRPAVTPLQTMIKRHTLKPEQIKKKLFLPHGSC